MPPLSASSTSFGIGRSIGRVVRPRYETLAQAERHIDQLEARVSQLKSNIQRMSDSNFARMQERQGTIDRLTGTIERLTQELEKARSADFYADIALPEPERRPVNSRREPSERRHWCVNCHKLCTSKSSSGGYEICATCGHSATWRIGEDEVALIRAEGQSASVTNHLVDVRCENWDEAVKIQRRRDAQVQYETRLDSTEAKATPLTPPVYPVWGEVATWMHEIGETHHPSTTAYARCLCDRTVDWVLARQAKEGNTDV